MSRICDVLGTTVMTGNNVSHAKNRTRRTFKPNLHNHKFWSPARKAFIKLKVCQKALRLIDRKGIDAVIDEYNILK